PWLVVGQDRVVARGGRGFRAARKRTGGRSREPPPPVGLARRPAGLEMREHPSRRQLERLAHVVALVAGRPAGAEDLVHPRGLVALEQLADLGWCADGAA